MFYIEVDIIKSLYENIKMMINLIKIR